MVHVCSTALQKTAVCNTALALANLCACASHVGTLYDCGVLKVLQTTKQRLKKSTPGNLVGPLQAGIQVLLEHQLALGIDTPELDPPTLLSKMSSLFF